MPPKRKDNATLAGPGPKQKRSKPSFQTPSTFATTDSNNTLANQPSSSNNRVITLRTSASGRRGYRSQDFSTASSTLNPSSTSDSSQQSPHENNEADACQHFLPANITCPELQSDSKAKPRTKQRNTTTVRLQCII